ncbi:unnamed protein product [Vitrella brassicaformis CCMP3155]|uniref:RNA helicase n=2 Tax=Vitrella brassicaformis TaxID=1169539 RepID=A0A0G4G1U0_VITBC|nr:unnamed protein product [Vitrella brassicaformis CCMP3155]|eukprot:CEM21925.1 unnamed protein product [Vitrella brassicaformis CCMP3155]
MARRGRTGSAAASPESSRVSKISDISDGLTRRLKALGIFKLFDIQRACLQPILEGHDVIGYSRTGTGKTLAYLLPIFQRLDAHKWAAEEPVLILTPTRELAEQVALSAFQLCSSSSSVHVSLLTGGESLKVQEASMRGGAHVIIGTPGRVCEACRQDVLSLKGLRVVVLDEFDELISRGFSEGLDEILKHASNSSSPHRHQTLAFSATVSPWLRDALKTYLTKPIIIDQIGKGESPVSDRVQHLKMKVASSSDVKRVRALTYLLSSAGEDANRVIIFTQTRHEAIMLSQHRWLQPISRVLHSEMVQTERQDTLTDFRRESFPILITTNLASRGLDFPGVSTVVHYTPPKTVEEYVHRAGRTGRGMEGGKSIVLYDASQERTVELIQRGIRKVFGEMDAPDESIVREGLIKRMEADLAPSDRVDGRAYMEEADKQMDLHGPKLLAASMALLDQRNRTASWASQLSGRFGYTPIVLHDPLMQHLRSRAHVMRFLTKLLPRSVSKVGRIAMVAKVGYLVDIPVQHVSHVFRAVKARTAPAAVHVSMLARNCRWQ